MESDQTEGSLHLKKEDARGNALPSTPSVKFRPLRCPSFKVRTLARPRSRDLGTGTGDSVQSPLPTRPARPCPRPCPASPGLRGEQPAPLLRRLPCAPLARPPGPGAGLTCQPAPRLAGPNVGRGRMTDGPVAQPTGAACGGPMGCAVRGGAPRL